MTVRAMYITIGILSLLLCLTFYTIYDMIFNDQCAATKWRSDMNALITYNLSVEDCWTYLGEHTYTGILETDPSWIFTGKNNNDKSNSVYTYKYNVGPDFDKLMSRYNPNWARERSLYKVTFEAHEYRYPERRSIEPYHVLVITDLNDVSTY